MSKYRQGLVLSIEQNEATETPDPGANDLEVAVTKVDIAKGLEDIQDQHSDIEDDHTALETAAASIDELSDIQSKVELSVVSGQGLDPKAAELSEIAVEAICRRVGIKNYRLVSCEDIKTKGRLQYSRLSVEQTEGVIARIWNWIKNFFTKIVQKVSDFITNLFKMSGKLLKRFEQLKKDIKALPNTGLDGEIVIENKELAANFTISKEASPRTVLAMLEHANEAGETRTQLNKAVDEMVTKVYPHLLQQVKSDSPAPIKQDQFSDTVATKLFQTLSKTIKFINEKTEKDDQLSIWFPPLYGGKSVLLQLNRKNNAMRVVKEYPTGYVAQETIQAASKDEMEVIADEAIDNLKKYISRKDEASEMKKLTNKSLKDMEKLFGDLEKSSSSVIETGVSMSGGQVKIDPDDMVSNRQKAIAYRNMTVNVFGIASQLTVTLQKEQFSCFVGASRYLEASIRVHGSGESGVINSRVKYPTALPASKK